MTLRNHIESKAYLTGCFVCGQGYDQVNEETVADYLHQTAKPIETVRDRVLKHNEIIDGLQSGVFTVVPEESRRLPPVTAKSTR